MRLKNFLMQRLKACKKSLRKKSKTAGPAKLPTKVPAKEPTQKFRLMDLPPELRLDIYDHVLFDAEAITISSAPVVGSPPDVVRHLQSTNRIAGLPQHHEPIMTRHYDPSLLSLRDPPTSMVTSDGSSTFTKASRNGLPTTDLLLANRQTYLEVTSEMVHLDKHRRISLFLSYPYGLHVLIHACPHLLERAHSVYISGFDDMGPERGLHVHALRQVISSVLGPDPLAPIEKLELRILSPGNRPYNTLSGDAKEPLNVAFSSIYGGNIRLGFYRNMKDKGTAVSLTAFPSPEKNVTINWANLGDEEVKDFVIDPKWPERDAEYQLATL